MRSLAETPSAAPDCSSWSAIELAPRVIEVRRPIGRRHPSAHVRIVLGEEGSDALEEIAAGAGASDGSARQARDLGAESDRSSTPPPARAILAEVRYGRVLLATYEACLPQRQLRQVLLPCGRMPLAPEAFRLTRYFTPSSRRIDALVLVPALERGPLEGIAQTLTLPPVDAAAALQFAALLTQRQERLRKPARR